MLSTLEKALNILCIFDSDKTSYSIKEVSAKFDMPKSTTYKYLEILINFGFLSKIEGTNRITIGPHFQKLAKLSSSSLTFTQDALPLMQSLSEKLGETVTLNIINGWNSMIIEKVESNSRIKYSAKIGSTLPLHAGSSSKLLLAYQKNAFINMYIKKIGLSKLTSKTIVNTEELKKSLGEIREAGYAVSCGEADLSAKAVSAPIFKSDNLVFASLSLIAPKERLPDDKLNEVINLVKETANEITILLNEI